MQKMDEWRGWHATAYLRGYWDAGHGRDFDTCPYLAASLRAKSWETGYREYPIAARRPSPEQEET